MVTWKYWCFSSTCFEIFLFPSPQLLVFSGIDAAQQIHSQDHASCETAFPVYSIRCPFLMPGYVLGIACSLSRNLQALQQIFLALKCAAGI